MTEILATFDLEPTDFYMILIGIVAFTVYWKVSESVLFGPLLKLFEEREAATVGAQEGATETLEEADKLESVYEESIAEARREAVSERAKVLSESGKKASVIVMEAETAAKEKIEKGREELAALESELRGKLNNDVESLADELATRVLSGSSQSSAGA